MEKIWIRLGGFVTADADTIAKIKSGDSEALVKAIKEFGFEVNGDTYIPADDNEEDSEEVGFEIEAPVVLTFFREK